MEMTYDDHTRVIVASLMRPAIRCQRASSRACGYIIRPEVRIPRMTERISMYLDGIGLPPRSVYSRPEEITRILSVAKGLEELVSDMESLELVKALNGVLKQPRSHREVLAAFDLIEGTDLSEP